MDSSYYVGLDIGTNSVGWAAVNSSDYSLVRRGGRTLWGARLFEEAQTAEQRRMFRTARRRGDRRKWRCRLLLDMFREPVNAVDPGFFKRLRDSKYIKADKEEHQPNTIFNDKDLTDRDYHKKYPTIYHLRHELVTSSEPHDVRLVYLAIHHIIKHRGRFLFDTLEDSQQVPDFAEVWENACNIIYDTLHISLECSDLGALQNVLKHKMSITGKQEKLLEVIDIGSCLNREYEDEDEESTELSKSDIKKKKTCIAGLLAGGKKELKDILSVQEESDDDKTKISLSADDLEVSLGVLEGIFGSDQIRVVESLKKVFDWALLAEVLNGCATLSEAKVKVYEEHRADLQKLKKVMRSLGAGKYKAMFKRMEGDNYCAYVGLCRGRNGKKIPFVKENQSTCSQEDFYKRLKKELKDCTLPEAKKILERIESGAFLPKQVTKDNGAVPNQVHQGELKAILANAKCYLPFLSKTDKYGSIADKIEKLLSFRIPYFVGPLNSSHADSKHRKGAWILKKKGFESVPVSPWNFEEVVDQERCAEEFIRRMTCTCSWLRSEDVLPKHSLLYQRYCVLNELNNLRINGTAITVELKQKIYHELFEKHPKVTFKSLLSFLSQEGLIGKKEGQECLSGIGGGQEGINCFTSGLSTLAKFKKAFSGMEMPAEAVLEEIVNAIVLFGQDKRMLRIRIANILGAGQKDAVVNKVIQLSFSDWGRLSERLLTGIYSQLDAGDLEKRNIIDAMWETNNNLGELLSSRYDYKKQIDEINKQESDGLPLTYDAVASMYLSPAVKRSLWQSITIVKEIVHIMHGEPPARIFVEMARGAEEKKRSQSRKSRLLDLYKACKNDARAKELMASLDNETDERLRGDRLYLYYTQMGKDMYTGAPINLEHLFDKNMYDIDHIYPQSKIVDDSLDNRVLVLRQLNARKGDELLSSDIRQKMAGFWKMLKEHCFISENKLKRLMRSNDFTQEELYGFVQRQLVETRQSSKAAAELLQQFYPKSEIVYVKAGNVSRFRQDFDVLKVRGLNDLHHAKDAYLNVVVGNVYHEKFTVFSRCHGGKTLPEHYHLYKLFVKDRVTSNGKVIWSVDKNMPIVLDTLERNNVMVTWMPMVDESEGFYKQNPLKHNRPNPDALVPLKVSDVRLKTSVYGGYDKPKIAYFTLVEYNGKKGKRARAIVGVPVMVMYFMRNDRDALTKYLQQQGFAEPKICINCIKVKSLLRINGTPLLINGKTNSSLLVTHTIELCLEPDDEKILKNVLKIEKRCKEQHGNDFLIDEEKDKISASSLSRLYSVFVDKLMNTVYSRYSAIAGQTDKLNDSYEKFKSMSLLEQCRLLAQLLNYFTCNAQSADIRAIGGGERTGILTVSCNISKYSSAQLICQSPTGFYTKVIDLLKV